MLYRAFLLLTAGFFTLTMPVNIAFSMNEQFDKASHYILQEKDTDTDSDSQEASLDQGVDIKTLVHKGKAIPVAIIGSGMAGLTAALNLHRDGFNPVIFMGPRPRGSLSSSAIMTENFPGGHVGSEVTGNRFKVAQEVKVHMVRANITKIEVPTKTKNYFTLTTNTNQTIKAASVIFAMGTHIRPLDNAIEGLYTYKDRIWGDTVWTNQQEYRHAVKGRHVTIIGSAVDAVNKALQTLESIPSSITFLVRDVEIKSSVALGVPQQTLKIIKDKATKMGLLPDSISVLYNTTLQKIEGDGHNITNLLVKNSKTGKTEELKTDVLVNATGRIPNTSFLPEEIKKLQDNRIWINCLSMQTSVNGAFAAGEIISDGLGRMPPMAGQGDMAIGSGAFAAQGTISYLRSIGINPEIIPHTGSLTHPYEPNEYSDLDTLKGFLKKAAKG